jgi:hypothetical protein
VQHAAERKERLREAREQGLDALRAVEQELGPLADTVLVREQYAFALNEMKDGRRAEQVLLDLLKCRGPSSETYGLLGSVYTNRWRQAMTDDEDMAPVLLEQATDAYVRGFESDWTDAYPGINAVTLMELRDPPDPRQAELLPVVLYGLVRRTARGTPDYWDFATQLELAVLARDQAAAGRALPRAIMALREGWEAHSTAKNLRLLRQARERRGEDAGWVRQLEETLVRRGDAKSPPARPVAPAGA